MTERPPVVALFGATALGKTDVAAALAERLAADVVVADSMQAYAGLSLLTNQPGEDLRRRVRYHLVGFVPPQQELTVAEFARAAHDILDRLQAAGRPAVIEGGSGLYLRAVLGGLDFAAPPDPALRAELERRWREDAAAVVAELLRRDPGAAARVDLRNPRRVIRALETALLAPDAARERDRLWRGGERYPHLLVGLDPGDDRAALHARIARRVAAMLAAGALDEVARARAAGPFSRTALQAIGVRELCAVLDGEMTLEEAAARMTARTRALARRQLTWLRKLPAHARLVVAGRGPEEVAEEVLGLVGRHAW